MISPSFKFDQPFPVYCLITVSQDNGENILIYAMSFDESFSLGILK